MAIEFQCPSCQQLFRTPEQAAGKKGKCPHCGSVFTIPATASPAGPAPAASAPAPMPAAAPAAAEASDKIEFPCSQCGCPVRTPASMAGKKGKCPSCGAVFQIPAAQPSPPAAASRASTARAPAGPPPLTPRSAAPAAGERLAAPRMPAPAPGGAAASGTAAPAAGAFACARCGKTLRMPPGSGGKKGKCPACGETFQIPAETAGRSAGPAPRPAASPSPVAGLTPIGNAGLTPLSESYEVLDDGGLAAADLSSGLTPLSGRLGALNMAPNPFADPLADPLVSAAAAGGLSVNPYQSPASLGTAKKRVRSRGDFGYVDVLSCAWSTLWDNWTSCLLLSLALMGLYLALGVVFAIVQSVLGMLAQFVPPVAGVVILLVVFVVTFVMLVVVGFVIQAGLIRISVNMVKGKPFSIGGLLQEGGYAGRLFIAALLQFLMGMGLGILLAVPVVGLTMLTGSPAVALVGQILSLVLNFLITILLLVVPHLIVDQDRGALDAISESASVMKGNILVTIGVLLTAIVGVILFVVVTLGLGLLLAGPFMLILLAAIYARATGQRTAF